VSRHLGPVTSRDFGHAARSCHGKNVGADVTLRYRAATRLGRRLGLLASAVGARRAFSRGVARGLAYNVPQSEARWIEYLRA